MKYIYTLLAAFVMSTAAFSQGFLLKVNNMANLLGAFYDEKGELGNFYLICSNVKGEYSQATGELTAPNGFVLFLDLYGEPNGGKSLPAGTYTPGDGTKPFTYSTEFSYIQKMDGDNKVAQTYPLEDNISVEVTEGGQVTILAYSTIGNSQKTFRYMGTPPFSTGSQTTDAMFQYTKDINTTFTGGISLYYGNLYQANTGNMVVRLYDCDFDPETGAQLSSGTAVELMLFNVLFQDPKDAEIAPGHYTLARNFQANTWFPGMTVNYMGIPVTFGTFAQILNQEDPSFGDQGYAWAYASAGTIDIEDLYNGNIRITLDLVSKTGYKIKGTYTGPQPSVLDMSNDKKGAVVSTLQENLLLDLKYVRHAEVYDNGVQEEGDCRSFSVDLGSDWDVDKGDDRFILHETDTNPNGADCMRLEFLVDQNAPYLTEGIYFVMAENYTNYFKAGRMRQGYFTQGEITGTRWMHLAPNRYYVMDGHAPAKSGSVTVQRVGLNDLGEDVYTFNINIIDDGGFNIIGDWTGPLRLHYDPKKINPDAEGIANVGGSLNHTSSRIYDLQGRAVSKAPKGIYLMQGQKIIK